MARYCLRNKICVLRGLVSLKPYLPRSALSVAIWVSMCWLFAVVFFVNPWMAKEALDANEWGDFFAGAFALPIFSILIASVLIQANELRATRKAAQSQAKAVKVQAKQSKTIGSIRARESVGRQIERFLNCGEVKIVLLGPTQRASHKQDSGDGEVSDAPIRQIVHLPGDSLLEWVGFLMGLEALLDRAHVAQTGIKAGSTMEHWIDLKSADFELQVFLERCRILRQIADTPSAGAELEISQADLNREKIPCKEDYAKRVLSICEAISTLNKSEVNFHALKEIAKEVRRDASEQF